MSAKTTDCLSWLSNMSDNLKLTQLIDTCKIGDLVLVKRLIREGVDLSGSDSNGLQALHWAARCGNKDVVEALLATNKVDINCEDNRMWTPLHFAVYFKQLSIIELLVKKKADCNLVSAEIVTPLHLAFNQFHDCCFKNGGEGCRKRWDFEVGSEIEASFASRVMKSPNFLETNCVYLAIAHYLIESGTCDLSIEDVNGLRAVDLLDGEYKAFFRVLCDGLKQKDQFVGGDCSNISLHSMKPQQLQEKQCSCLFESDKLRKEVSELHKRFSTKEDEFRRLGAKNEELKATIDELSIELKKKNEEASRANKKRSEMSSKVEKLKNQLKSKTDEVKSLNSRIANFEETKEKLKKEKTANTVKHSRSEAELLELRMKFQYLCAEATKLQIVNKSLIANNKQLVNELNIQRHFSQTGPSENELFSALNSSIRSDDEYLDSLICKIEDCLGSADDGEEMKRFLNVVLFRMESKINSSARVKIDEVKREHGSKVAELNSKFYELNQEMKNKESEVEQLKKAHSEMEAAICEKDELIKDLQKAKDQSMRDDETNKLQKDEILKLKSSVDEFENVVALKDTENDTLRSTLTECRARVREKEKCVKKLQKTSKQLEKTKDELKHKLTEMENESNKQISQLNKVKLQNESQIECLIEEKKCLESQLNEKAANVNNLKEAIANLQMQTVNSRNMK